MNNKALHTQKDIDTSPQVIIGISTDAQDTRQRRHLEVYLHMTDKLDEIIDQLEGLITGISGETGTPLSEMKQETPGISLQQFIQHEVFEKIENFADQATKRIIQIKEMLF